MLETQIMTLQILFIGPTVLLQLTFTFINSIFNKKFSVSVKYVNPKQALRQKFQVEVFLYLNIN